RGRPFVSRYLLCNCAFPLCSITRCCLRYLCRLVLLVSKNDRVLVLRSDRQDAFLGDVHRGQFGILPYAFFRTCRNAAPGGRLSGCLLPLELHRVGWILHFGRGFSSVFRRNNLCFRSEEGGCPQPLGRRGNDARMDATLTAAFSPV